MSDLSKLPTEELLKMYQQPADGLGSMSTEQLMALYQQQPQGGAMERANSFLGGAVEGMPIVGPYIKSGSEKAAAGIRSLMHGTPYDEELKTVQGYAQQNAKAHPYLNTGGNVAGAVIGTAPLVAAAPAAFGAAGGPMGARMAASGATGAAIGGADAAVRSDFDPMQAARGAAIGGLTGAAAPPIAEGVGRIVGALTQKRPPVMTPEQLRDAKNSAYRTVDDLGVQYSPNAVDDLVTGMRDEMAAAKINPLRHPKASSMLDDVGSLSGKTPSLTEVDQLRQVIRRDVANASDDAEAFFGKKMIKNIDEWTRAAGPSQVVSGDAQQASRAIGQARELNTRLSKVEDVEEAVSRARLRAGGTGSGGNIDNATRQELRRVLENMPHATPDERAAFEKAIVGSKTQNALRLAGKLSPAGNGLMAALGIGATMTNPIYGVPALAATGAKALADRMTQKNVSELVRLLAAGGDKSAPELAKRISPQTERLVRALLSSAPPVANQRLLAQ